MQTDGRTKRKTAGHFEPLETRWLLSSVPLAERASPEFWVERTEFERRWQAWPSSDLEFDAVVFRAALEAGRLPDTPASRVDSNNGGAYGGVGSLRIRKPNETTICTGSVIDANHVLSAAHCFDGDNDGNLDSALQVTFFLNDGGSPSASITASRIVVHPDFGGFASNGAHNDLAVVTLEESVPSSTPRYQLRGFGIEVGETMTLVGYGGSGHGDVAGDEVAADFHVRRSGRNQVDLVASDQDNEDSKLFFYDFDGPTGAGVLGGPTLGNDVETVVRSGDSGAPALVDGVIAGVNTFEFAFNSRSSQSGEFGVLGGGVVLGRAEIDWIYAAMGRPDLAGGLPEANIRAARESLVEGGEELQLTVSRTGSLDSSLAVEYRVSGTASADDYSGLSGVAIIPAGVLETTIAVRAVDDAVGEGNEEIVVTLLPRTGYRLGGSSEVVIDLQDNDGPPAGIFPTDPNAPLVTVTASRSATSEDGDPVRIRFERDGEIHSDLHIGYRVGGSAASGADYRALSGSATIAAGTPFTSLEILPIDDMFREGTEEVSVTLVPSFSYKGGGAGVTVSILDNEPEGAGGEPPTPDLASEVATVEITAAPLTVSEASAGSHLTFTRTGNLSSNLLIRYEVNGTADAADDYVGLSGTVVIPAGQASTQLAVQPLQDGRVEPAETVVISLLPDADYRFGTATQATIQIVDSDAPIDEGIDVGRNEVTSLPVISVVSNASEIIEGVTGARLTFARQGTLTDSVVVAYSVGGTAVAGEDFAPLSGLVTIPAGLPFVHLELSPLADSFPERDETIIVTLDPNSNYTLGSSTAATVTIRGETS